MKLGILLAGLIMGFAVMNHVHRTEVDEAYKQGAVDAAALYKKPSKEDQELLALQWWTGSTDMKSVRNKLCTGKYK